MKNNFCFSVKIPTPTTSKGKMPQSKKDLRAQKQRANVKAGIGDEKGRVASNQKVNSNTFYTRSDHSMGCWLTYCFRTSFKLRFSTMIVSFRMHP